MTIHNWSLDLKTCPIKSPSKESHEHYMQCEDCGLKRYGAFAEYGAYHFFTYDHPDKMRHEALPPCNKDIPQGYEVKTIIICNRCSHDLYDKNECRYDCDAGFRILQCVQMTKEPFSRYGLE